MDIIKEVKKLVLPPQHYVVFGSGILSVKGIRPSNDLDLIVDEYLYKVLQSRGWTRKFFFTRVFTCKLIVYGRAEAFSHARIGGYRPTNEYLFQTAELIDGVPFMNLWELRRFKEVLGRPKDRRDIVLIEEYLRRNP